MTKLRQFAAVALAPVLACLALIATAPAANSLPPYQPQCATLEISTTTPLVGAQVTLTGRFFEPGATVQLLMQTTTYHLADVTVGADGSFTKVVTLPAGVTGHHTIYAQGGRSEGCPVVRISITIGGHGTGPGDNGGPSVTGFDVALMLAVALGLLALGFLINDRASNRRRRDARHAHRASH